MPEIGDENISNIFQYENNDLQLLKDIRQWLLSDAMKGLFKAFNMEFPEGMEMKSLIDYFDKQSICWDYRNQKNERWMVNNGQLADAQKEAVYRAIRPLGLGESGKATLDEYDFILALGGAKYACLYRMRYVAQLIKKEKVFAPKIIGLSCFREILHSERSATDTYAPNAATEYDLMNRSIEEEFLIEDFVENIDLCENNNLSSAYRKYIDMEKREIISIAAPSTEEARRANSADTFNFFALKENLKINKRILLVTSQIYVPYQQIEAIRILGKRYHANVETIGYPQEWNIEMQSAENYLQEIRSTIQAMKRLLDTMEV